MKRAEYVILLAVLALTAPIHWTLGQEPARRLPLPLDETELRTAWSKLSDEQVGDVVRGNGLSRSVWTITCRIDARRRPPRIEWRWLVRWPNERWRY